MLIMGMLCIILSLGLVSWTLYALAEMAREQHEFEATVALTLDKYTDIMNNLLARQTRTENVVMDGQQLRLTLNEIEQYNRKQAGSGRRPRSKTIPLGGGP